MSSAAQKEAIHEYRTLGHMCHPDDYVPCCQYGPAHPIHQVAEVTP